MATNVPARRIGEVLVVAALVLLLVPSHLHAQVIQQVGTFTMLASESRVFYFNPKFLGLAARKSLKYQQH